MLDKLQQHIAQQFPFLEGEKLLIAISGGLDSVVLTRLLQQLNFNISLAHCNFNLRGNESDADENFIKILGDKLEIPTFIIGFDTDTYAKEKKLSTQLAARALRYDWFDKLAEKHSFDFVITAHHADDNLETFLINLSRGTGLEGLTGIPTINKNIVRPFLIFSRDEIEEYAVQNNIEWREDQSNASTKYVRNKIRHQIVPVLKEINPNLLGSFLKTTEHLRQSQQIINDTIDAVKKEALENSENEIVKISILEIKKLSNPKAYLFEILKEYGFTEWNDVLNLLEAQSGKHVFSKTHRLLKDRSFLFISKTNKNVQNIIYSIDENTSKITTPIHLTFEKVTEASAENKHTIFIDADTISFPLTLRKWQDGDFFYPKGIQGKKKISKFFKDEKHSLIDKDNTWLLCANNKIIWVVDHRQDNRFTPQTNSSSILKIKRLF